MKFYDCLKSLPVGLSKMPDLSALRWFSNNSQRDDHFNKQWSDELIGAEEEQQTFSRKFVKIKSRRDGVPLAANWVGKFTDCVGPNESQKSFAEVPWQVREVPTPRQLA